MSRKKIILIVTIVAVLVAICATGIFLLKQTEKQEPVETFPTQATVYEHFDIQLEPDRKELPNRTKAEQIKEHMLIGEVYSIMGKPQRNVGSGAIVLEWDLYSGEVLIVSFNQDVDTKDWVVVGKLIKMPEDS